MIYILLIVLLILCCISTGRLALLPAATARAAQSDSGPYQMSCISTSEDGIKCAVIDTATGDLIKVFEPHSKSFCNRYSNFYLDSCNR